MVVHIDHRIPIGIRYRLDPGPRGHEFAYLGLGGLHANQQQSS